MVKLENLQNKEKEAIEELRQRMKSTLTSEMYDDDLLFYRFLKARKFDINKAELMLTNNLAYQKVFQVDTILQDFKPSEVFTKHIRGSYVGEDKEGYPVRYFPMGKIDIRDILKCFKMYNYFSHWIWHMEEEKARLKETNIKNNTNVWKYVFILDLDKLELANALHPASASYLRKIAETYQDNYPETLKSIYIINAPAYYVYVFSVVKMILDLEVVRKIHVYSKSGWKEELLKVIDADTLPAFLGGTRTDPDGNPRCETFICQGGRVPPKNFLSKEDRTFKDKREVKHVTIPPRTNHQVFADVEEYGSVIQWEFEVHDKDIGFSLYFKESEYELKEILPLFRFETPDGTHNGSLKCQWTGTYVIIFDNSFSWFSTKDVSYCVSVITPGERHS